MRTCVALALLEDLMTGWQPKRRERKWREFLTSEEMVTVSLLEGEGEALRSRLAAITASLNPIRQRASQRALHAERAGAK